MATPVVVIEVEVWPGQMKPGLKNGGTGKRTLATKEANLIEEYAGFIDDVNFATLFSDINTAIDAVDAGNP